jgi:hypothetical protein
MRRSIMLQVVTVMTSLMWLYLLSVFVAATWMSRDNASELLTGVAATLVVCCVIAASIYSALRPRRLILAFLFIASLVPAYFFGRALWVELNLFRAHYLDMLRSNVGKCFWTATAVIFVVLACCWAAACLRFARGKIDLTSR